MIKLNMRALLGGFILSSLISASAMSDDLEIYLGIANEQTTYAPNVLFIMDSSGSMAGRDGGTQTRLLRVQNALKETLESAPNVNAGLMRFSDFGVPFCIQSGILMILLTQMLLPLLQLRVTMGMKFQR